MEANELILPVLGYIMAFFIAVFITRAIFSIPKFLKMQKAQTQLLIELAKKTGCDRERIDSIEAEINYRG